MISRSTSDLAHFYTTSLLRDLKSYEKTRKAVLGRVIIVLIIGGAVVAVALTLDLVYDLGWGLAVGATLATAAVGSFLYKFIISDYVHQFKLGIIKRIVEFVDPSLEYWPTGHISDVEFNSSRIFCQYPDRMRGDDLVWGKIGVTPIKFSEVYAEHETQTTDRYGRRHRRYSTIFRGLFFMADFNKSFYGKTVVLPDTAERLFGGLGSLLQSLNRSRGDLVKLDDPEFEKHFVVYADDQVEARYVLSTSLMKRIVEFRKKTDKRIHLSFVGSQAFLAIPYRRPLFEPRVFSRITGFKHVKEYFEDLQLALGIVEDLNLNTRIWTKRVSPTENI